MQWWEYNLQLCQAGTSLSLREEKRNTVLEVMRENHRMDWLGRGLKDHLVSTPCHEQGHLPLDFIWLSEWQPCNKSTTKWCSTAEHSWGELLTLTKLSFFFFFPVCLLFILHHLQPKNMSMNHFLYCFVVGFFPFSVHFVLLRGKKNI